MTGRMADYRPFLVFPVLAGFFVAYHFGYLGPTTYSLIGAILATTYLVLLVKNEAEGVEA